MYVGEGAWWRGGVVRNEGWRERAETEGGEARSRRRLQNGEGFRRAGWVSSAGIGQERDMAAGRVHVAVLGTRIT